MTDAGRPREAAEHFRIALQTIRGSADVHNNLGIALMGEGKTDEAIAEFRPPSQLDPESATSHRNLADALAVGKAVRPRRSTNSAAPRGSIRPAPRPTTSAASSSSSIGPKKRSPPSARR